MRTPLALALLATASSLLASPPVGAQNLPPNPGFESCAGAPSGWTPLAAAVLGCDSTNPDAGTFAAVLSGTQGTSGGLIVQADSDCVPLTPNSVLTGSAFSYRTSDQSVSQVAFTLYFYAAADCSGSPGSVSSIGAGFNFAPTLVTDGQWNVVTAGGGLPVPNDVHGGKFRLSFQFTTPGSAAVAFDELMYGTNATTTTSTAPVSTTTTTLAGACVPADCDDGDVCTTDVCAAGACTSTLAAGTAGVRCLVAQMKALPLCGAESVPSKQSAAIGKALDRADVLLVKLDAASGNKRVKLGKKASRAVGRISKTAKRAVAKRQISSTCQAALTAGATRIQTAIGAID